VSLPAGCKLIEEDYNPASGLTTKYWLRLDGKVTVQVLQDVDPIFDQNAVERNATSAKSRKDYGEGLGAKVASIPMGLVENINQEKGLNLITCSEADLKKFVNSPEYAKIRTAHGDI
jgi:hypothetical protein